MMVFPPPSVRSRIICPWARTDGMVGRTKTWMACILPFAVILAVLGTILLLVYSANPTNGLVFPLPGAVLLIPSLIGYQRYRLNSRDKGKVLRMVGVRTSTTVTEVMQETGLEREFILETIKNAILCRQIFGTIDDEETFIRDVSARREEVRDEQIGLDKMSLFDS